MSKILCAKSGVFFTTEHFKFSLSSREYEHPIFRVKLDKLLKLYDSYLAGTLTPTEDYLLFLAILDSTELIEWRVPAKYTETTKGLVANNIANLVYAVTHLNIINNPNVQFARIAITPDTKTLDNVKYWLMSWIQSYNDFINNSRATQLRSTILQLETKLEAQIKNPQKNDIIFSNILAEWAAKAGNFPEIPVLHDNKVIPCSIYWKMIIRKANDSYSSISINSDNVKKLIEHCESNIEAGSIYSHALFTRLNKLLRKTSNSFGFELVNTNTVEETYTILDRNKSVEEANKLIVIQGAPETVPDQKDYPSKISYLRAKLAYDMAQNYKSRDSNS